MSRVPLRVHSLPPLSVIGQRPDTKAKARPPLFVFFSSVRNSILIPSLCLRFRRHRLKLPRLLILHVLLNDCFGSLSLADGNVSAWCSFPPVFPPTTKVPRLIFCSSLCCVGPLAEIPNGDLPLSSDFFSLPPFFHIVPFPDFFFLRSLPFRGG